MTEEISTVATPQNPNSIEFDYKDVETLLRFVNSQGRIYSAQRTGLNARNQRKMKRAVKYARFLALMPHTV
ncbi:MAG: 30S ribosomal protein S18 [Planctomycetes bacterium]|nr:30S ribosomal protein S18 [Planctomycetota bacterium]NQU48991.1 30S ribosomal protein S18 [Planctomycetota bacterium]